MTEIAPVQPSSVNSASASNVDVLDLARRRLQWLEKRQSVLAGNVANANTPGYVPKDVTPFQGVLNKHLSVTLARTKPGHMSPHNEGTEIVRSRGMASPDRNEVDIENELEKVASNSDQQRLASNAYAAYNSMLSIVLGTER